MLLCTESCATLHGLLHPQVLLHPQGLTLYLPIRRICGSTPTCTPAHGCLISHFKSMEPAGLMRPWGGLWETEVGRHTGTQQPVL